MIDIQEMGRQARESSRIMARASTVQKNDLIQAIASQLLASADEILEANAGDVADGRAANLTPALLDRLTLDRSRLHGIAADLRRLASMSDPVGERFEETTLPNGLQVYKQRVPIGVLAVIYESRPNVTLDVASLAIKTGNAAILRGGKETLGTNRVLVHLVRSALEQHGLPPDAIQFIDSPDRGLLLDLLGLHEFVDLIIPRGGASLHSFCREVSRIPVITGGIGICHLFVDETADHEAALRVIHNAKTQRPTVCNALDTVLVHESIAANFLPPLIEKLQASGVAFRLGPNALDLVLPPGLQAQELPEGVELAGPDDFDTEWLSLVLGVKVVPDLDAAIAHIQAHSTGHSDGILTRDDRNAQRFVAEVDSAAVYVNASTRFTDGGQLGLGAEAAISTQRLHARGPMGLKELTTYKWVIVGENHVRP